MTLDPQQFRADSRASWADAAPAWATYAPTKLKQAMPVTSRMLERAAIQPGAELLELAAGNGEVGYMALELAQPGGKLIVSDFVPEMVTAAQERAAELGIAGVRFKQIDAESIDLPAASVDTVICRWGLMFVLDPVAALRECRRVLRPGGRLSTAVWTGPEENRWSSDMTAVLRERGHLAPLASGTPDQFAWRDAETVRGWLAEAGWLLEDVTIEPVDFVFREPFSEWWERTSKIMRSTAKIITQLDPAERDAVRDAAYGRLSEFETGGCLAIPARCLVIAAPA